MAVPKRRTSKQRKRKRRGQDVAATTAHQSCPRCGDPRRPHRVCPTCGHYGDREVVRTEEF
ncbi:MAG: 50S ribosomal protein L32 [Gemmatimonadota bacterium]|jgi:large subunit ribosomal protein L32